MKPTLMAAALAAATTLLPIAGLSQTQPPVAVSGAWARATPPGATTGVVYLTLTSTEADRLTGATSPVASKAGLHESRLDSGMMRMVPVPGGLALPAGQPVALHPEGFHIMLDGLKTPLIAGSTFPLHLAFQHAPAEDVTVSIRPIGATGPADPMAGMDMGK